MIACFLSQIGGLPRHFTFEQCRASLVKYIMVDAPEQERKTIFVSIFQKF